MAKKRKRKQRKPGRELTYWPQRKGYKKYIGGKTYYFRLGQCPQDSDGSYYEALKEYLTLRDRLDKERAEQLQEEVDKSLLPNGSSLSGTLAYSTNYDWNSLLDDETETDSSGRIKQRTIQALVNLYLEERRLLAESGQRSLQTYGSDEYHLGIFLSFCNSQGKGQLVEVVTTEFLNKYRKALLKALARGKASAVHVKHCLRTVKALLLWAVDDELIDRLPGKVRTLAKVELPEPKPVFWSEKEVRELWQEAGSKTRLYVLLGLNCGWTQKEISSFTHDMIDWQTGIVTRDRNKTGVGGQWKLWPEALALLREHATDPSESELVLLSPRGKPLVYDRMKQGKYIKTDSIRQALRTVMTKCGMKNARTFKHFRKTGSEFIGKQFQDMPFLVDLYLAHASQGMKKHYANQHYDELHKATDWLRTQFDFSE